MKRFAPDCLSMNLKPRLTYHTSLQVVELEISLDETREQYNTIVKSSNLKAQQRKMDFLTRNLDQLTSVQRQVRICICSTHEAIH